jgi:hypothetical protein
MLTAASVLLTFDLLKAKDSNGNAIEPKQEYLETLIVYVVERTFLHTELILTLLFPLLFLQSGKALPMHYPTAVQPSERTRPGGNQCGVT